MEPFSGVRRSSAPTRRSVYRMREMPSMKRTWVSAFALLFSTMLLTSCANTIRGAGQDLKNTANAVEDVVD